MDFEKGTEEKIYSEIMEQKEKITEAFVAETGLKPSECRIVVRHIQNSGSFGTEISVERKQFSRNKAIDSLKRIKRLASEEMDTLLDFPVNMKEIKDICNNLLEDKGE